MVVLLESILAVLVPFWCRGGGGALVVLAVGQGCAIPRMLFSRVALGVYGVVFVFGYDPSLKPTKRHRRPLYGLKILGNKNPAERGA